MPNFIALVLLEPEILRVLQFERVYTWNMPRSKQYIKFHDSLLYRTRDLTSLGLKLS